MFGSILYIVQEVDCSSVCTGAYGTHAKDTGSIWSVIVCFQRLCSDLFDHSCVIQHLLLTTVEEIRNKYQHACVHAGLKSLRELQDFTTGQCYIEIARPLFNPADTAQDFVGNPRCALPSTLFLCRSRPVRPPLIHGVCN